MCVVYINDDNKGWAIYKYGRGEKSNTLVNLGTE